LGYVDGVTSAIQTQLNSKEGTVALTASRAVQSDGSGVLEASDVTTTELGYLDGVTSAIQTQLDAKMVSTTRAEADADGTVRMSVSGTTLYITNDGTNAEA